MSRPSREVIYSALFALLNAQPGLKQCSRRLINAQDIAIESFPAAFQLQGPQSITKKANLPPVFVLHCSWIINTYSDDMNVSPSTALNNLTDACMAVLVPGAGFPEQTLGGLVTSCAVEGEIQIYEGVLGNRAVAVIPIRLTLPGY